MPNTQGSANYELAREQLGLPRSLSRHSSAGPRRAAGMRSQARHAEDEGYGAYFNIPEGHHVITEDVTFNVFCNVEGLLDIASGITVTFAAGMRGTMAQHFTGSGTVEVAGATEPVRPEYWGVTGTADQTPINAALAACKHVKLAPDTTYVINNDVTIPADRILEGTNQSTVIRFAATDIGIKNDTNAGNITIRDLYIDGDHNTLGDAAGLSALIFFQTGTGQNYTFERLFMFDATYSAMRIVGSSGVDTNVKVENCDVHTALAHGVEFSDYVTNSSVRGCWVFNVDTAGAIGAPTEEHGTAIFMSGTGTSDNVITDNYCDLGENGVRSNAENNIISNNRTTNMFIDGLRLRAGGLVCIGNRAWSNGQQGLKVEDAVSPDKSIVMGNMIHDNTQSGMQVRYTNSAPNNIIIIGNMIDSNGAHGCHILSGINVLFMGNDLLNNTQHGLYLHAKDELVDPPNPTIPPQPLIGVKAVHNYFRGNGGSHNDFLMFDENGGIGEVDFSFNRLDGRSKEIIEITSVSQANPAVVTYVEPTTEPSDGESVVFEVCTTMTTLNGNTYVVENLNTTANTFRLRDTSDDLTITDIDQATPVGTVTYTGTDPSNGDYVHITGVVGMTEVNDTTFKVSNVNAGANTFELHDEDDQDVATNGYTAYDSGGTIQQLIDSSGYTAWGTGTGRFSRIIGNGGIVVLQDSLTTGGTRLFWNNVDNHKTSEISLAGGFDGIIHHEGDGEPTDACGPGRTWVVRDAGTSPSVNFKRIGGRWFREEVVRSSVAYTVSALGNNPTTADMAAYTKGANEMGGSGGMVVKAAGTKTGTGDGKAIIFHWGNQSWTCVPSNADAGDWEVEVDILNSAANAQKISWRGWSNGSLVDHGYEAGTEDTSSDVVVKTAAEIADGGVLDAGETVVHQKWTFEDY